jgi:hypothetical protein
MRDDFRDSFVIGDLSCDADALAAVRLFGIARLRTVKLAVTRRSGTKK